MALRTGLCVVLLLLMPVAARAEDNHGGHEHLPVPVWMVLPFVGLLLSIALLPIFAAHFWHSNLRKALVAALFAVPVIIFLYLLERDGKPGMHALMHSLQEYSSFIVLLFALYTVAGGVVVEGSFRPTPLVNVLFLGIGAALANLIGTTGASMVLIRPMLRINRQRGRPAHIPIFFIFAVSNLGGLLTPLGDPPLFLGFLRGVRFSWTFFLWPQWLTAVGSVLLIFLVWDTIAWLRDGGTAAVAEQRAPFQIRGLINIVFLLGILGAVLLQSESFSKPVTELCRQYFACPDLQLRYPASEMAMTGFALLSILFTSRELRQTNAFSWEAIVEVAVLFAGIFIAMVPALELMAVNAESFGLSEPWHYFWLTGLLSSFLDNAPTYVTFATIAGGSSDFAALMHHPKEFLQAISCGAVFFGAMTYIGNGPNFMVKAIAEASGYKTPSFFGYLIYSCAILLPIFVLITLLFFWK